jgi:selenocysteine-specific elongation factor
MRHFVWGGLQIDRSFTIAGFGTVVTGTLVDGSLRAGQEVVVEPGGLRTRIRGLQSHRHKVESTEPGSRTAVNVAGLGAEALHRGMVLTTPGWLEPTTAVDVRLHAVRDLSRPLRHNVQVTFHSGSAEVPAKLRLLDADTLEPGHDAWAQVRLLEPAAVVKGDAFVLRSPNATIAGGTVVDGHPRRHRRHHAPTIASLVSLEQGSPEDTVYEVLAKLEPADPAAIARETDLGAQGVQDAVQALVAQGRVTVVGAESPGPGALCYTLPGIQKLTDRATKTVHGFLAEHRLRAGIPREELKSRLGVTQQRLFNNLAARWVADGVFEERGAALTLPGHEIALSPAEQKEAERFLAALRANPYAPAVERWPDRALVAYLVETRAAVAVKDDIVFDAGAYGRMEEGIRTHLRTNPTITLAQVRDLFGTSRRYAQAFLEHLDERHITRRVGDERVLRGPEAVAR